MEKSTPNIINVLTYRLPFELANQIYNEFHSRLKEINFIIEKSPRYRSLKKDYKVVELLLALSIFNKRVISNLDAAVKFHGRITRYSTAETIKIGTYELDGIERNKLLGVVMNYNQLIERFQIPNSVMDYFLTKEFLLNVKRFKDSFEYDN